MAGLRQMTRSLSTALLCVLCSCTSYRHKQDVRWNEDHAWIWWPTNAAALMPPKPHQVRAAEAIAGPVPRTTVPLAWYHADEPNIVYNVYMASDWKGWHIVATTTEKQFVAPLELEFGAFYVTASNTLTHLESVSPWNP